MELKRFEKNMINEVVTVFRETILTINRKDYSMEQVKVWANNSQTLDEWLDRFEKSTTYVAIINGVIVGFGNLTEDGWIDLLYVHKDHQAEGIASGIVNQLEKDAKLRMINRLSTDASITAKPFFLSHGYQTHKEQSKLIAGVSFTNYKMTKLI
ncbi:GNAT family N-acetyltransferase [Virgibacillus necropolis]|uniref:GNAT family N-acetyltransferase n=1 Tax=Virgibacillus necropolis TaxID=163877 RepID=A0A221M7E5_9BACI|nr:GNAT family N-acetyltransferase [Virgibacillus necropolis]ASN03557.1 GNAT family N-acetyltransferase [Virgibacillus necropolis]